MMLPSRSRQRLFLTLTLITWIGIAHADCNSHTPAFPPVLIDAKSDAVQRARQDIESILYEAIGQPGQETVSFSTAVTSKAETLFEIHHSATERDEKRPGRNTVDGESSYRIASCTKTFTVLALLQLQKAGNISLDDPINKYVPELDKPHNGTLPWKDITLRALASQLSGMPRDMAQSDSIADLSDPISHGLPPLSPSSHHEIQCDSIVNYTRSCTKHDLLNRLQNALPLFAPKQLATYSNLNYELLSLALESASSTPYQTLIQTSIFNPLNLTSTTFSRPPDHLATLPIHNHFYWDFDMGIQSPTGGLYSTTNDLSKFIRYILTSYNGLSPALNWIQPAAYSLGLHTFYGAPWEIFRTDKILPYTNRPITFVTKSGGLPGYTSYMVTVPDYDFGFTILVASGPNGTDMASTALETIAVRMVQAADELGQANLAARYTGLWRAEDRCGLNSSFRLAHSLERGLWVEQWVSNGTDVLGELGVIGFSGVSEAAGRNQYLQLVPTLLFKDVERAEGEIWRVIGHRVEGPSGFKGVFRDFCVTDVDVGSYGGLPLGEVVFWDEEKEEGGAGFGMVELTGFRVKLQRVREDKEKLVVQM